MIINVKYRVLAFRSKLDNKLYYDVQYKNTYFGFISCFWKSITKNYPLTFKDSEVLINNHWTNFIKNKL